MWLTLIQITHHLVANVLGQIGLRPPHPHIMVMDKTVIMARPQHQLIKLGDRAVFKEEILQITGAAVLVTKIDPVRFLGAIEARFAAVDSEAGSDIKLDLASRRKVFQIHGSFPLLAMLGGMVVQGIQVGPISHYRNNRDGLVVGDEKVRFGINLTHRSPGLAKDLGANDG
jgi:hypothetical protein